MHQHQKTRWILLLTLLAALFTSAAAGPNFTTIHAAPLQADVTAYDLIAAMNALRVANGLPALVEDPIIDAVAQGTAQTMAANNMSWHIGNVSGRLQSAGYGGGATVYGTENFAVGNMTLDEIMVIWSDASHMIPAVNPAYCNVGAGIASTSDGRYYYVLQAAYTSNGSCGDYVPSGNDSTPSVGNTGGYGIIVPVEVATPDADGKIYHEVKSGQSFWSIAIAYHVTIKDIQTWNNLGSSTTLQIGQKLFIPDKNTAGYATPTPVDMVQKSTPDADGKIIHTVAAYNTLSTIANAYGVSVETILTLNGLQADWPLQIGQKILIYPGNITPSPTPRPLTPIEKLTPAADGKYYHTVHSGETISWIANYYGISAADLLAWNNLNASSILQLNQKLLLQVTPPATATATPGLATDTPTPTPVTPTATPTLSPTPTITLTPTPKPLIDMSGGSIWVGASILGLLVGIGVIAAMVLKKR